jgi:hypothetical protein
MRGRDAVRHGDGVRVREGRYADRRRRAEAIYRGRNVLPLGAPTIELPGTRAATNSDMAVWKLRLLASTAREARRYGGDAGAVFVEAGGSLGRAWSLVRETTAPVGQQPNTITVPQASVDNASPSAGRRAQQEARGHGSRAEDTTQTSPRDRAQRGTCTMGLCCVRQPIAATGSDPKTVDKARMRLARAFLLVCSEDSTPPSE